MFSVHIEHVSIIWHRPYCQNGLPVTRLGLAVKRIGIRLAVTSFTKAQSLSTEQLWQEILT